MQKEYYCDFIISKPIEDKKELTEQIIRRITIERIKAKKPSIIFLQGDSGEGKSMTALKIGLVAEEDGLDLEKQIIYTPYEYAQKVKWMFYSEEAKKKHVLIMMEARELVKSKLWYSVINQSIADINALSRAVKPISFIIISQDVGDIDRDVRKTIQYFGLVWRPLKGIGRLKLFRVMKLPYFNNPKVYTRLLKGYIKTKEGKWKKVVLDKIYVRLPPKEIVKKFEEIDFKAKSKIILRKLENLMKILEKTMPSATKIEKLVEFYTSNPESLKLILKRGKGGTFRIKKEVKELHELSNQEFRDFSKLLYSKLIEKGLVAQAKEEGKNG